MYDWHDEYSKKKKIYANFGVFSLCELMKKHTLPRPPKCLPIPISVLVVKHACYSELREGQGNGRHPSKLGASLTKL